MAMFAPIIDFGNNLKTLDMDPRDAVMGGVTLAALMLAFLYFALGWATNRMKDWEALKADSERLGSPAMVCWTAAAGSLSIAIFGTHIFVLLYVVLNSRVYVWHVIPIVSMAIICLYFWIYLISLFQLHLRYRGELHPFTSAMLEAIRDYRKGLWVTILCIKLIAWSCLIECLVGDFVAGFMGICFLLVSLSGLGCCMALRADLFPRAVANGDHHRVPEKAKSFPNSEVISSEDRLEAQRSS